MKKHFNTYLSIILALSMLLSMLPIYAAATDDEFEGLEIVEEIPFEFELEPGDLPLDMLANAVLPAADLPSYISASLAAERDHVNRLYLQEPDANTVMFQNRDGSKTIYVFSKPVKNTGLTLGTNALAVNGGKIAFSGNNIITNRIGLNAAGKQIQDYKIGYSDIQTLPGGVLTANGIEITEDVRNWAVSEFGSADAEYTISDSASAAYTASVSVIETELMANVGASASANAVTPGITITPINPSPATGATVMSITYSDLAGKMCFKNAGTNQYLTLHPTNRNTLVTTANIYGTYSYWIVKFVGTNKYTICSYYDRPNKYLGTYGEEVAMAIEPLNVLDEPYFSINIVSSTTNTVEILCYHDTDYALSSNGDFYDWSMDIEIPTSCHWIITNRSDYVEVQSITPQGTQANIRTVMAGSDFYPLYTTNPTSPTESEIRLYYADINQELPYGGSDEEEDEDAPTAYCIPNTGTYTVYYKDELTGVKSANFTIQVVTNVTAITPSSTTRVEQKSVPFAPYFATTPLNYVVYDINLYYADDDDETEDVAVSKNADGLYYINNAGVYIVYYKDTVTGVRSEDFLLIIVASVETYGEKETYSITRAVLPEGVNEPLYLTRHITNGLILEKKNLINKEVTRRGSVPGDIQWQDLDNISRTFTFDYVNDAIGMESGVYITATRSTNQYTGMPIGNYIDTNLDVNNCPDYSLGNANSVANTICYSTSGLNLIARNNGGSPFFVCNMGNYYLLICDVYRDSNNEIVIMALKSSAAFDEDNNLVTSVTVAQLTNLDDFKWNVYKVGVDVPVIKQTFRQWCGPTSFLQVLYGVGAEGNVSGTSMHLKQRAIRDMFAGVLDDPAYLLNNQYTNDINDSELLPSGYICKEITITSTLTQEEVCELIDGSFNDGMACIFFTVTGGYPYKFSYDPDNFGHLECIVGYDELTETVIINNCHYMEYRIGLSEIRLSDLCADMETLWYFDKTNN